MISMLHRNTFAKFMYSSKKRQKRIARIMLIVMLCIAILSVSVNLVGCGEQSKITCGEIYGKEYQPAREWTEEISHFHMVGKVPITTYTTEKRTTPERYLLHVREYDDKNHKYIYAAFEVTEEKYNSYDFYDTYVPRINNE